MYDVVIVGAGPAGATAAIAAKRARPDARVLLLDRADFPRDKSCGDGIAPQVLDVLTTLGVDDLMADQVPLRTLELSLDGTSVTRRMSRDAWVVPRTVFDARLVQAAIGAGAELRRHRVRSVQVGTEAVLLDGEIRARVVVAADGAHSVLHRALGRALGQAPSRSSSFWRSSSGASSGRRAPRRALALRGYAPTPPTRAARQVIRFGRTRQPSYAWSFDRGDGWCNVGYGELLQPGRPAPTRALMLDQLDDLLPEATSGAGHWLGHHLPLSPAWWGQPDGRVLLAGDAASLVNPLTGEGIYYAVATGALAGQSAVCRPGPHVGAQHRSRVRRLLAAHLLTTAAVSRVAHVPGVLPAGLRAASADQAVFDELVEIGLGRGLPSTRTVAGLLRHTVR